MRCIIFYFTHKSSWPNGSVETPCHREFDTACVPLVEFMYLVFTRVQLVEFMYLVFTRVPLVELIVLRIHSCAICRVYVSRQSCSLACLW